MIRIQAFMIGVYLLDRRIVESGFFVCTDFLLSLMLRGFVSLRITRGIAMLFSVRHVFPIFMSTWLSIL
ncbi:hypothetical protein EDC30_11573 [Paucimonas lemoignei]|uniref:Uncharacterized protein n=1 Tax=Paucimonas lemoignei TaxID=29443 RepID=A0A4R3HT18_PAULE|nr:hypothetical protein EDC30_11573 [Paucimonas lemoignei]